MSKDMKIMYLCGSIQPHREGISKEVFALHRHFKNSFVIGTSPDGTFMHSLRDKYFGFPSRLLATLRYWLRLFTGSFDRIHIFHGIDCYHYLKARGKRPVILTAISIDRILSMDHYAGLRMIVVESSRDREKLLAHGFDSGKVAVIYPGTDLSLFSDREPPPEGPFRILFASSPFSLEYMESRGVRLLLEAAKLTGDVEYVLLWRKRGDTLSLLRQWIKELGVGNVTVIHEDLGEMNRMYRQSHATILPYKSEKNTKSCPNSAIESLATGRPVLVSDRVGIADLVRRQECGVVFEADVDSLVRAVHAVRENYGTLQGNARGCADRHFDLNAFFSSYERLYAEAKL